MNQTDILTQDLIWILNVLLIALISYNNVFFNSNEKFILLVNQIKVQNDTLGQLNIANQTLATFSQIDISQRIVNILSSSFILT
jgi:hypothetical protein